jgi:hypothetical protein
VLAVSSSTLVGSLRRSTGAAAAGALLAFAAPALAQAPAGLVRISGASPLARSCQTAAAQRGSEVEPTIAVDPRDPRVLVAAWQQDRYTAGGGAAALGVAYSRDGGATWARAVVPGVTECRGRGGRNSDPWLSFGPDGTVYLASLPGSISGARGLRTSVAVSTSRDGGATWSQPIRVSRAGDRSGDKEAVTADPTRPGHAYVVWSEIDRILMARTTDGGLTWSAPRAIATGQVLNISTISVLEDGTLLHAYFAAGRRREAVLTSRSSDAGLSWSRPVRAGTVADVTPFDPRTGIAARSAPVAAPGAVGGPDGSAYAAWLTAGQGGLARVVVARSSDGGRRWSRPRVAVGGTTHAFTPSLAITPGGVVGVTAYRFRARGRADVVASLSADGGRTWRLRRLSSPFSLRRSPRAHADLRFLGDYTGLAADAGGFSAAPALGPPLARSGRSDVFFARVPVPQAG